LSRGAGVIERRIADLLAATRDQALSIEAITDHAFKLRGKRPTRAQRLSATRAAHRLLKRTREIHSRARKLIHRAHERTAAAVDRDTNNELYEAQLEADPDFIAGGKLYDQAARIGSFVRFVRDDDRPGVIKADTDFWCAEIVNRRLFLHPPDVPVRVWAVSFGPGGITWAEAEVIKVTERNVMVRYAGEKARLDRAGLWRWWAFWRGVRFVSSRTGRIAAELDALWWRRYGMRGVVPPALQMPLAEAMALLGVPADYNKDDVLSGFRRAVKRAHPDVGGTEEMFCKLVEARDRLLTALGTSAPPPPPPNYAPKGAAIMYRTIGTSRSSRPRLGGGVRRLT
jgi:hypothetical protein